MPPEQLPWDRRDFRKHERSGSDPRFGGGGFGGGGPHRWREQHPHPHPPQTHAPPYHHNHQQQHQRWYSDFRSSRPIPPGHGKQGGWHVYPDDAGHGFLPFGSRYGDRNLEDDNFRPLANRGDGRYFRNIRENRGSFSKKDWRSQSWEPAASSSGPARPTTGVNNQKSLENTETCHDNHSKNNDSSHPLPDSLLDQPRSVVKEEDHEKSSAADGLTTSGQNCEKEHGLEPIDWKPLKWSRSGSLSSRGSGFSQSSSSKSMGVDSEMVVDTQQKNVTPVQSPAAVCVVLSASAPSPSPTPTPTPSDETSSRKKPRLGWGEGLAKYEKKKVEGPEEGSAKDGLVVSVNDTETMQLPSVNLLDKNPRVASLSDCTSPTTPSSVGCNSSPGTEEKESIKAANVDHNTGNLSCPPSIMPQTDYEGPAFHLENLELSSIAHLSSLINELLQSGDKSSVETEYVRTTSMNKLLVWKVNMLKALEVTESEIDSLETELKSLVCEPSGCGPQPASSSLLTGECYLKPCEERVTGSSFTLGPVPSQAVSPRVMIFKSLPAVLEDEHVTLKDEEIDSPGSATSKLVELPSGEDAFASEAPQCVKNFMSSDPKNFSNLEICSENGLSTGDDTYCTDYHKPTEINCNGSANAGSVHSDIGHVYDSILSSNKDSVNMAMEELNKLLLAQQSLFDISTASSVSSLQRDSVIKENFIMKRRSLKFKEKVLTLKFKVFKHFWKEGRVVSIRKLRGKTHKKFDLSRTGCKRNRSSSRSRISYPVGCSGTVPAEEVVEFVNGLLSEATPLKPCRNTLKMPALILDKDTRMSRFISNNALVEDPCAVEKGRSMINPWTAEERELFIDKLAVFGKDFSKIASFLEHKTVADCIEFYYKNHKSEYFERARKKPDFAKQRKSQSSTYLVATGKRWNRELNAASLDILGEASIIAASMNDPIETQQKCTSRIISGASSSQKESRGEDGRLQRSNSLDMYNNETVAADVLAGICGSLSSEAMSSCITSSVDIIDGYHDRKCQRVGSCVKRPLTPDVTQNVDDECSDESCGEMDPTDWTDEEKSIFIQAVSSYGKDLLMISKCVRTRSKEQCKIFFSKARKCLGLDQIQPGDRNAVSGEVNGGGSDTEDACVVQTCSPTCNDGSECKVDGNLSRDDMKSSHESGIDKHNLKPNSEMCVVTRGPCSLDSMAAERDLQNLSRDDSLVDDNPSADFNVDRQEQDSSANGACGCDYEVRTSAVPSNTESLGDRGGDKSGPNVLSEADNKAVAGVSDWHHGEDKGQRPEGNLVSKKVQDDNSSELTIISCAVNEIKSDTRITGNISRPSIEVQYGCRMEADLQTCSTEKSHAPFERNCHFPSMESSMLFSVPIKYQRHASSNILSNGGANGINEQNSYKVFRTVDCQQHLSGYSHSDPVDFSQILRGYPVSVQNVKEMSRDHNCKKHIPLENVPKRDEKLHSDQCSEFSLTKSSGLKHPREVEAPFSSQDQSREHSRPQSGSAADVDKPSGNGNVKLFGKILTSTHQKPDSCLQRRGDNDQHQQPSSQTLNLKFTGDHKVNLDSSQSKLDSNNHLGSENIPVRSFGFWDGNRANSGFPPLPDSTLLLAKYPAAFSNHSMSNVKLDQPPLHGVIRSNDHSLNGVAVYPNRELSSSNGLADYQVLRNRELQPFSLDMKQQHDVLFSEMQRRNGFNVASGIQQQARAMVGINVVGRGGLVVGGQCSGVSDPVAAIKMHYASQNLCMPAGNGVREDETWTSNGDVGR